MKKSSEKYFDWDQVPEGFDWVAIDGDGEIFGYQKKPHHWEEMRSWAEWSGHAYIESTGRVHNNWKQLIFKRPTTEKP